MSHDFNPPRVDYTSLPPYPERYVMPVRARSKRAQVGDWLLVASVIGAVLAVLGMLAVAVSTGNIPVGEPVPPLFDAIMFAGMWVLLGSGVLAGVGVWLLVSGKAGRR